MDVINAACAKQANQKVASYVNAGRAGWMSPPESPTAIGSLDGAALLGFVLEDTVIVVFVGRAGMIVEFS
jgi:hypothetical protein